VNPASVKKVKDKKQKSWLNIKNVVGDAYTRTGANVSFSRSHEGFVRYRDLNGLPQYLYIFRH